MEYDAYVYDLDGTLVHLDVDWAAAREEVAAALREAGVDPGDRDLWSMLDLADETGTREAVERILSEREREGARTSRRLPPADRLPHEVPVGVCSLNCEDACRRALDEHGLSPFVASVVGRNTVPTRKPDPEPVLAVVRELGVDPARTLFVGDSESDERAAKRAGLAFTYAAEYQRA